MRARTVGWSLVALLLAAPVVALNYVGWQIVVGPARRAVSPTPFQATPERVTRGRYLSHGPLACFTCHGGPVAGDPGRPVPGTGAAAPLPPTPFGSIPARNITADPVVGVGTWTDDELARAIREGVSRDGTALFPVMPYADYAALDDEDVVSVVVYLRTLPPVAARVPASVPAWPLSLLQNTFPRPLARGVGPHPVATAEERGQYLAAIAGCGRCHTPRNWRGAPLPGLALAGGSPVTDPRGPARVVAAPNITPDASGIRLYDEPRFHALMREPRHGVGEPRPATPTSAYGTMTDADLRDLWAFLRVQPAVVHHVNTRDAPTACARCGQTHGLGAANIK